MEDADALVLLVKRILRMASKVLPLWPRLPRNMASKRAPPPPQGDVDGEPTPPPALVALALSDDHDWGPVIGKKALAKRRCERCWMIAWVEGAKYEQRLATHCERRPASIAAIHSSHSIRIGYSPTHKVPI